MRTRTLLLLAVACGVAILAAGVALFWRIGNEPEATAPSPIGEPVGIGDLTITVERYREQAGRGIVTLEIGGVDDPDGTREFRLVVPGSALRPSSDPAPPDGPPRCGATSVGAARCVLLFDLGDAAGSSRVLLYRRGDEQVRWEVGG
jgi:hypothetical protein